MKRLSSPTKVWLVNFYLSETYAPRGAVKLQQVTVPARTRRGAIATACNRTKTEPWALHVKRSTATVLYIVPR
jgi:hypothetical protein